MTITAGKKTITAGKSFRFQASAGERTSDITWSVSNKKIGTISKTGLFKAKRKGSVTIVAACGGQTAKYKVNVVGKKLIGIDAGHQSKGNSKLEAVGPGAKSKKAKVAGGTAGVYSRVPEYELTLEIALEVKEELLDRGYDVVLTRFKNNVDISNKERAELINDSGADICIRLHADGASSSSAKGASALYPSTKNKYVSELSKESMKLGKSVLDAYCDETGRRNRGLVARDDLTGTNWSKVPVIVLEMGFMTNKSDDTYMQTEKGQKAMVKGIADGIDDYYK
ncbi:N-acetylmuramoyl-L-alanine amidase [Anaerolentibacter hominis]|uniref:N-acetylmuramoyl-L-alanine amidase n=1 Tax=Anaerolentibacter hominis TaxID=3079009 RepID=UPI0031B817B6